jgi:hypothetical protein
MRAARVLHTAGVSHHFAGESLVLTRELIYPLLCLGQPLLQTMKKKSVTQKRKKNAVSSCCARSMGTDAVADNNVGALGAKEVANAGERVQRAENNHTQ